MVFIIYSLIKQLWQVHDVLAHRVLAVAIHDRLYAIAIIAIDSLGITGFVLALDITRSPSPTSREDRRGSNRDHSHRRKPRRDEDSRSRSPQHLRRYSPDERGKPLLAYFNVSIRANYAFYWQSIQCYFIIIIDRRHRGGSGDYSRPRSKEDRPPPSAQSPSRDKGK